MYSSLCGGQEEKGGHPFGFFLLPVKWEGWPCIWGFGHAFGVFLLPVKWEGRSCIWVLSSPGEVRRAAMHLGFFFSRWSEKGDHAYLGFFFSRWSEKGGHAFGFFLLPVKLKLFRKVESQSPQQTNKQTNKQKIVVLVTDETQHKSWSLHIMNHDVEAENSRL